MSYLVVTPAFTKGTLKTQAEVRAHFTKGGDFQIRSIGPDDGRYVNKTDLPAGTKMQVRYGIGGTKVMTLP